MNARGLACALAAAATAAALVYGCAAHSSGAVAALGVDASPVTITPDELHGLRLVDAVQLSADHAELGGFSGLLVEGDRLTAVTDQGWLMTAALASGDRLRLGPASFGPLPGLVASEGKAGADAELLARRDAALAVGFEGDHRVGIFKDGRQTGAIRDRRFGGTINDGLEALATLPDGALLAIREWPENGASPAFVLRPDGGVAMKRLALGETMQVTGADLGPDGRLYVLRRDFALLPGFSARIERYRLGPDGFPLPETREMLARFESDSGIDNMEGIAVWRDAAGATRLMLISDDNFNWFQRILLLEFAVE